jgi:Mrp family chromosome partitioning ATPase
MSRPPALDPEAERWAARFEAPPPASPPRDASPPRKRSGRWKTQVMGSMVPLEVQAAREERAPPSESEPRAPESQPPPAQERGLVLAQPALRPSTLVHYDVPSGWQPSFDSADPRIITLRDAVLEQSASRRLKVAVTGAAGNGKEQLASALAFALAEKGARVLLVEADFDNPQLHQALGINPPFGAGFSQQLIARRNSHSRPWAVVRCSPTLQVLAEGRMRSPGLLGSDDFARAMAELIEQHHVIVMHAPSIDRQADLRAIDVLAEAAVVSNGKQPPAIRFGSNPLRGLI